MPWKLSNLCRISIHNATIDFDNSRRGKRRESNQQTHDANTNCTFHRCKKKIGKRSSNKSTITVSPCAHSFTFEATTACDKIERLPCLTSNICEFHGCCPRCVRHPKCIDQPNGKICFVRVLISVYALRLIGRVIVIWNCAYRCQFGECVLANKQTVIR